MKRTWIAAVLASVLTAASTPKPALELRRIAETDGGQPPNQPLLEVSSCSSCESRTIRLIDGKQIRLSVEREPRLVVPASEVQELRAGHVRSVFDPNLTYWEVIAIPTASAREKIARTVREFPAHRFLVSVDAHPSVVEAAPGLEHGLIAGQFSTREGALDLTTHLGIPTQWVEFDEKAYRENRNWFEKATKAEP